MFLDNSAIFCQHRCRGHWHHLPHCSHCKILQPTNQCAWPKTIGGSQSNVHFDWVHQDIKYLDCWYRRKRVASLTKEHSRISQKTVAFASFKWPFCKKAHISIKPKIHLFWTLILPILLYGLETCTQIRHKQTWVLPNEMLGTYPRCLLWSPS